MSREVGEAQKMDGNSFRRRDQNYPPYSIEVPTRGKTRAFPEEEEKPSSS
jgi:hypothetical protein